MSNTPSIAYLFPAVLCFSTVLFSSYPPRSLLVLRLIRFRQCGFEEQADDDATCDEDEVSAKAANLATWLVVVTALLSIVVSGFMSGLANRHGRRIPPVLVCLGEFVNCVLTSAVVRYKLPVEWLILGAAVEGASGTYTAFLMATSSYVSDLNTMDSDGNQPPGKEPLTEAEKGERYSFVEAALTVGILVGPICGGLVVQALGYTSFFLLLSALVLLLALYFTAVVPETLGLVVPAALPANDKNEDEAERGGACSGVACFGKGETTGSSDSTWSVFRLAFASRPYDPAGGTWEGGPAAIHSESGADSNSGGAHHRRRVRSNNQSTHNNSNNNNNNHHHHDDDAYSSETGSTGELNKNLLIYEECSEERRGDGDRGSRGSNVSDQDDHGGGSTCDGGGGGSESSSGTHRVDAIRLWRVSVAFMLLYGSNNAMAILFILYTARAWDWGSVEIGAFISVIGGVGTLSLLFSRRVCRWCSVELSDLAYMRVGALAAVLFNVSFALLHSPLAAYCLVPLLGVQMGAMPSYRALYAAAYEPADRSRIFAAVSVLEAVPDLLAPLVFTQIYAHTVSVFPTAAFFCIGVSSLVAFMLLSSAKTTILACDVTERRPSSSLVVGRSGT
eukprot:CAMPEP_0171712780 /NCGR_PEP_ID=MMETSP0991-20121206/17366_1 /TAXON_ID=483369 /ORGANISM="non described non described, Strain CCMP2098" /LENGTH=617 /DNA_ID=CAMNT_0012303321 /DNA_START=374 /DNA_END=2227 /DNA_ORIENTATION=-